MSSQKRSYYWEALKQHRRTVALIIAMTITAPLFVFTSLPPVEIVEEVPREVEEEVSIPIAVNKTIEVKVNKTIEVEKNITQEVVVNRTIGVNITEGGSIFLEPQPTPPLIDTDIILCIDTSGSMDIDRMPLAKAAILNTVKMLNQSYFANLSNDRIALVSFDANLGDWTTDATVHAGLDYISNQSHVDLIISETESLVGSGNTDAWAGLNKSLDLILKNPRNTTVIKSIIFLTDGKHNTGPWGTEVNSGDYNGFLQLPSNIGPYSESPIVIARNNSVKIYSIGLFEGIYTFDENFLRNISLDPSYGTFGDFFAGNDTLSLIESFLRARDSASGWVTMLNNETTLVGNGITQLFSFNVTQDIRRLKWDLHWNNSLIDFNLTVINPNGSIIEIGYNITKDISIIELQQQKSIILDFPMLGEWNFNISWENFSKSEPLIYRLSSYEPPIFIKSVSQLNSTINPQSILPSFLISEISQNNNYNMLPNSKIQISANTDENETSSSNRSVLFMVNVTNKNPLFSYHNITPILLANFTGLNVSYNWSPNSVPQLNVNSSVSFIFNLTFLEPTFLKGNIYFKVNCSEGFYDAVTQDVLLDYRIITENITIETYLENQTITIIENQTITVLENQNITTMIITNILTNVLKYTYNRQVFDTLKWIGFFTTFALLMSFLVIFIVSRAHHLKAIASQFRFRLAKLFPDRSMLESILEKEGISIPAENLGTILDSADNLDELGQSIYQMTGKRMSPEDLIRVASGVSPEQIAQRLNIVTGIPIDEIITKMKGASSIESLIEQLNLDGDRFFDILARDEQVLGFQQKVKKLMRPQAIYHSDIILNDDLDIIKFRSRIRKEFKANRR